MRKERPFSPLLYAPLTPTERTKRTTMYVDPDARGFVLPSTLSASLGEYLLTSALLSPKPFTPWATLPTHEEAIEALRFRLAIAPGAAITCTLDYDGYRCICWHAALGAIFTTTNGQPSGQTITAACAAPVLSSIRKQLDEAYSQTKTALRSAGADNPSSGVVTFTDANQLETPIGKQWAIDALRSLLPEYYENENTAQPYGLDPAEIGGARKPTKETADALNASIRAVLRESMHLQGLHILLCSVEAMPAIDTGLLGALSGAACVPVPPVRDSLKPSTRHKRTLPAASEEREALPMRSKKRESRSNSSPRNVCNSMNRTTCAGKEAPKIPTTRRPLICERNTASSALTGRHARTCAFKRERHGTPGKPPIINF